MVYNYYEWIKNGKPKIFCKCNCNQEIIIKFYHKYYGIPECIKGHFWREKHHSEETRLKMSEWQKGEKSSNFGTHLSEETKGKISESLKGVCRSKETRQKISEANKGKHPSEETRQKISESHIGLHIGENNSMFGKYHSEETRQKISESNKNPSKETRRKMSEAKKNIFEETRQKMSEAKKGENNPNWNGGITDKPYCEKWTPKLREEIRNQYNRKCYLCGKDEKDNITKNGKQWKLSVHHIDADKEQGCNGKSWKLVPLCLQCHGKIHNRKIKYL